MNGKIFQLENKKNEWTKEWMSLLNKWSNEWGYGMNEHIKTRNEIIEK